MIDVPINSGEVLADRQLMELVAQGDGEAMEQLYDRYQGTVLAFFRNRDISETQAEDLAQDVFAAVWKQAGRNQSVYPTVKIYLLAIAKNHLKQFLRSQMRYAQNMSIWVALEQDRKPDSPDVLQTAVKNILIARMGKMLNVLSESQRHVLDLIYWQGLTVQEAAREMDCTRYKCESLHQKALKLLQKAYAKKEF